MSNPQISVVIVHWNTQELLTKQLKELAKSKLISKIIVVDNDTLDKKSVQKTSKVEIIYLPHNYGYSFGCNTGLAKVQTEWTLFLNPDAVPNPSQIENWLEWTISHHLDATSPSSQSKDYTKPIPSFWSLLSEFTPLNRLVPQRLFGNKTLIGGSLLIKTKVVKKMGGWDERFFLWFEDSDLSYRLSQQFKIGFWPESIAHVGAKSFDGVSSRWQKNVFFNHLLIYAKKHLPSWQVFFLKRITHRFNSSPTLPIDPKLSHHLTIPNMKFKLASSWLDKQYSTIDFGNTEVTLVSSDLSATDFWDLKQRYPLLRIIKLDSNQGFAQTVNLGMRISRSKWNCTINDDAFAKKSWLQNLTKAAPTTTGSINPIILNSNNKVESAGIEVLPIGKAQPITDLPNRTQITDATNAAAVCYNQQALEHVGFFDEKFGSYLEDIDLSLRLFNAGFSNQINPKVSVTHLGHQTSKNWTTKKHWLDFKNWNLIILKNWKFKDYLSGNVFLVVERLRNLSAVIKSII